MKVIRAMSFCVAVLLMAPIHLWLSLFHGNQPTYLLSMELWDQLVRSSCGMDHTTCQESKPLGSALVERYEILRSHGTSAIPTYERNWESLPHSVRRRIGFRCGSISVSKNPPTTMP